MAATQLGELFARQSRPICFYAANSARRALPQVESMAVALNHYERCLGNGMLVQKDGKS